MRQECSVSVLEAKAHNIRKKVIESIHEAGSGHPGGSLSIAEMLSVLYFREMNIDPTRPDWEDRDRFVLSKGHAAPAYYAALSERGYFPEEEMLRLRKIGGILQGHPDRRKTPGVDMSTGSLGQGISAATGMALYAKTRRKSFRVYCVIGDGEMQEGQVWEAMMAAAHYRLGNLTVLLDRNGLQIDGSVEKVMNIESICDKAAAFGWQTLDADGHDPESICRALDEARAENEMPAFIVCRTVKGKGISFMEHMAGWHGACITDEHYTAAMKELCG